VVRMSAGDCESAGANTAAYMNVVSAQIELAASHATWQICCSYAGIARFIIHDLSRGMAVTAIIVGYLGHVHIYLQVQSNTFATPFDPG
jgi:uncharacterized membrane protein